MSAWHRFLSLNWATAVLTPLAVILMESFCVYPWLLFLGQWPTLPVQRAPLSLLSIIIFIGGSYMVTRYFSSRKWPLLLVQLSIIISGLIAVFLVIRIEYASGFPFFSQVWYSFYGQTIFNAFNQLHPIIIAIPVGFFLWWRGISRGRTPLYLESIYPAFLIGMAALVALVIFWGASAKMGTLQDLTSSVGIYIAGFFFFGLAALALANLQAVQARLKQKEGMSRGFERRWLIIITGVIGGVTIIGVGIASLFSSQVIAFLGRALNVASDIFARIAYYIFIPIGYLMEWLVWIFKWIINWLRHGQEPPPFQPSGLGTPENLVSENPGQFPPQVLLILKWAFFALVIAAIIFLLIKAIMRYRVSRENSDIEEEDESLWSWSGFKTDLSLFLNSIKRRFERKEKPPTPVDPDWTKETDARLNIRDIYRLLLWKMSRLQMPRRHGETPIEYARRLKELLPETEKQVVELTGLYVQIRYGEIAAEKNKVDEANNLWKDLKRLLPPQDTKNS